MFKRNQTFNIQTFNLPSILFYKLLGYSWIPSLKAVLSKIREIYYCQTLLQ